MALGTSIALGRDFGELRPRGEGSSGDGMGEWLGEWLRPEQVEGDASAIGDDVFHPKNDVSLFGPGDLGVLVMADGSGPSWFTTARRSTLICKALGRTPRRDDMVAARCTPSLLAALCDFEAS